MKKKLEDMTDWERFEARLHRKGQVVQEVSVREIQSSDLRQHQVAAIQSLATNSTMLVDVGMGK